MPTNDKTLLEPTQAQLYTMLILRELGASTHLQLLYFVTDSELMNDIELVLALRALTENGLAAVIERPTEGLYRLTEAGIETLSFFENHMRHSIATAICEKAPGYRERYEKQNQFSTAITRERRGDYVAHLCLMEGDIAAMELKLNVPLQEMAEKLTGAWEKHAGEIYRYLLSQLNEEET